MRRDAASETGRERARGRRRAPRAAAGAPEPGAGAAAEHLPRVLSFVCTAGILKVCTLR